MKKDDNVWAHFGDRMQVRSGRTNQIVDATPNALARLSALLDLVADELENNQARVRFIGRFDPMYARGWPAERLIALENCGDSVIGESCISRPKGIEYI